MKNAKWIGSGIRVVTRTTGEVSPALQLRKEFDLEQFENALSSMLVTLSGRTTLVTPEQP